jgi:hypothetical protein
LSKIWTQTYSKSCLCCKYFRMLLYQFVSIFQTMLQSHFHFYNTLIRRTSGRSLENPQTKHCCF